MLCGGSQAPITQIRTRLCTASRLQLLLEELGRHLHYVVERGAFRFAYFHFSVARGHGNARHVGNTLHCFREAEPLQFRQEAEMIASDTAAEAVVAAFAILAVKAR